MEPYIQQIEWSLLTFAQIAGVTLGRGSACTRNRRQSRSSKQVTNKSSPICVITITTQSFLETELRCLNGGGTHCPASLGV